MSMKYSEEHEWVTVEGEIATVGITHYAQKSLGDIVFVESPDLGIEISQGDEAGVVESVKAASDIFHQYQALLLRPMRYSMMCQKL